MKTLKIVILLLLCTLLWSCDDETPPLPTAFEGQKVKVGDGNAWTYIITNSQQQPVSIGVRLEASALRNLPAGSAHAEEFLLPLPEGFSIAPYDHITLDWNEKGHEPPGVYDLPHFDFHFYFMTLEERNQIGAMDTAAFNKPLAPEYLASDYLETPGGVPRMGAHIIDLLSPEIAGSGPFTHTFIYGKYDGTINFLEPMITKAFLEGKIPVSKAIRKPEKWQSAGYYPDQYQIGYDATTSTYFLALEGLTYASGGD